MGNEVRCIRASGQSASAGAYLAQKYDADVGFRPGEAECHIVRTFAPPGGPDDEVEVNALLSTRAWLTGLWRADSGALFVTDSRGKLYVSRNGGTRDPADVTWDEKKVDCTLWGTWGLAEDRVWAWGRRSGTGTLFRWNGRSWSEVPAPDFPLDSLHGPSEKFLLGSGEGGKIARWDGGRWTTTQTPIEELLVSVHVAGRDEYYAAGNMGTILEGSDSGWARIAKIPKALQGDVQAVAKWNDELWVAVSRLGLWKRTGKTNKFVAAKKALSAVSLEAREQLVVGYFDGIASSTDGATFDAYGQGYPPP